MDSYFSDDSFEDLLAALKESLEERDAQRFGNLLIGSNELHESEESEFIKEILDIVAIHGYDETIQIFINFLESELTLEDKMADLRKQLIVAVCRNNLEELEILLKRDAAESDEVFSDDIYYIVDFLVLSKNRVEVLELFMKHSPCLTDIEDLCEQPNLYEILMKFRRRGVAEIAQAFYDRGLTAVDEAHCYHEYSYVTPLTCAIVKNNSEMAEFLIGKGADVNRCADLGDLDGYDLPLKRAFSMKNEDMVNLLLKNGANINASVSDKSKTLLHEFFYPYTDVSMIKLMLRKGADVNAEDKYRKTPIYSVDPDFVDNYYECLFVMVKALSRSPVISKTNMKYLRANKTAKKIFDKCLVELDRMKNTIFYAPFSYHSVLVMSNLRKLSNLTKNEEFVNAFLAKINSFNYFSEDLKSILDDAVKLREEFETITSHLQSIFEEILPDIVLDIISEKLTVSDIRFE